MNNRQIVKGLGRWLDSEILNQTGPGVKYGVGVAAAMLSRRGEILLEEAKESKPVKLMGLVRDGEYRLDELREDMLQNFPEEGLRIKAETINQIINRALGKLGPILNIQLTGSITVRKHDVETLFRFLMEE
jgi:hypothetical protein